VQGIGHAAAHRIMDDSINRGWWAVVLRGLLAVVFGVLVLSVPGVGFYMLVLLFGAYAFAEGVTNVAAAIGSGSRTDGAKALALEGVVSIGVALVTLFWPGITAMVLVYAIALWAIVTGGLEIAATLRLRRYVRNVWLLAIAGMLSILFGLMALAIPAAGALVIVSWVGAYALVFGGLLVALGIGMRSHGGDLPSYGGRMAPVG
jgi:uncharacterized membrane protein HdeD (DUF308 family)